MNCSSSATEFVLYEGRIIKEVDIESANIESLGLAMAGINE